MVAAVVPWVVLAVVLLGETGGGPDGEEPAGASQPGDPTTETQLEDPGPAPVPGSQDPPADGAEPDASRDDPDHDASGPPPVEAPDPAGGETEFMTLRGAWRGQAGEQDAAAMATVVARAWLTGTGPDLAIDGVPAPEPGRYVEHLAVEGVAMAGPEAAVVTLLAIVLDERGEDDEDALTVDVRRLAVPIALEARAARPAGSPWMLPGPELDAAVPISDAVDDPDRLAAAENALERTGFERIELRELSRTSSWPWIAQVRARTPGGERVDGPVWLRWHLDRFVVAGTIVPDETSEESAP